MNTILIIISLYLIIGFIIAIITENFAKEQDCEFFDSIFDYEYIVYFLGIIIMWLPDLVEYFKYKNNQDDSSKM